MKPCSKTRSDKSTCANIFLELPLTILFRHYLGMNATSCCWSYIDFYTLITYNYILTHTYNSDTIAGAEFISSPQRCSWNFSSASLYGKLHKLKKMITMMNSFCDMVDWRKTFSLISSPDYCQRSSPWTI